MSLAFDCLLASYLLLASLTIWCAQSTASVYSIATDTQLAGASRLRHAGSVQAALRAITPCLAALPHALGSLGCLIAALALLVGTPFDIRYAAVGVLAVGLYFLMINLSHLIEDWHNGVSPRRMVCVRSLLPALLSAPMLLAGLRLL